MKFYGTGAGPAVAHSSPSCPALHWSRKHPVVELTEIHRLCKTCFKGQVSAVHVRCSVCKHKTIHPCPHNGGVMAEGPTRLIWVWPETAYTRTLVNSLHMG